MIHDNRGDTVPERLARLEEKVDNLGNIQDTLEELRLELSRYKGFFGGILFLISCLGAAVKAIPFINGLLHK